jgi:UDPglucose 6-dehydrogenase
MDDPVVSIVGLGKLGCPMMACLASRGCRVIGVDTNEAYLRLLREGHPPVNEPSLAELLRAHGDRISVTNDHRTAVLASQITFVVVATPSKDDGTYSLRYVQAACENIGSALREKRGFHVVAITSTVLPEDMDTTVRPILEATSGRRCGEDFGLCYNPEFIALGSVVRDMLNPDFVLIGESDERSGGILEALHRKVVGDHVPVVRTSLVNAELAKIAVNTFVTTKISYANMLAEVCERIPGCDVDVVTSAIGLDSRIGSKYLQGRLGYGGPCFPRDNLAFGAMARQRGTTASLAEVTDAVNRRQVVRLAGRVRKLVAPGGRLGILGLTYKPRTDVVEEAQGVHLAKASAAAGIPVIVYDPLGMPNAREVLAETVEYASSAEECVQKSQVVVIATPWDEFKQLAPQHFAHNPRRTVIDCWRILPAEDVGRVADYMTIGKFHPEP